MGPGQTAKKQPEKNNRNTPKTAVMTVFRVFRLLFRLFFGFLTGTHSAPFRLFSICQAFGTSVDGIEIASLARGRRIPNLASEKAHKLFFT